MTKCIIYSLSDPETNKVRYLGVAATLESITFEMAQRRNGVRRIVSKADRLEDIQREGWLRELTKANLDPVVKLETETTLEDSDKVFKQILKSLQALGHPVARTKAPGRPVESDLVVGAEAAAKRKAKHTSVIGAAEKKMARLTSDIEQLTLENAQREQAIQSDAQGVQLSPRIKEALKFYPYLIIEDTVKITQLKNAVKREEQRKQEAQEKLDAITEANRCV